ncbi:MAG: YfiR family protein [Bacteriovoracaceae bacterium]|nr:YfiR family protein [Bacteriovoracaceae bacterium]
MTHKLVVLFLSLGFSTILSAQVSQTKLESIFIHKFISFITWPSPIGDVFKICVSGDEKLRAELSHSFSYKKIKGASAVVVATYPDKPESDCTVLVTGADSGEFDPETCGECFHITKRKDLFSRCAILLKIEDSKVRFDINYKYATKKRFKVHSKLLKIANHVLR